VIGVVVLGLKVPNDQQFAWSAALLPLSAVMVARVCAFEPTLKSPVKSNAARNFIFFML
jgi:hypothetical protein